jgi:hypothetical protein
MTTGTGHYRHDAIRFPGTYPQLNDDNSVIDLPGSWPRHFGHWFWWICCIRLRAPNPAAGAGESLVITPECVL